MPGCHGEFIVQPKDVLSRTGASVNFTCTSNLSSHPFEWHWCYARQKSTTLVYDGRLRENMGVRFEVHDRAVNDRRESVITVKSCSLRDGGYLICRERLGLGKEAYSSLTVVDEPKCTAICVDDVLLVRCTLDYWGSNDLASYLQLIGPSSKTDIRAKHNSNTLDQANHYVKHTLLADHRVTSCEAIQTQQLVMVVKDESVNNTNVVFNITVRNLQLDKEDSAVFYTPSLEMMTVISTSVITMEELPVCRGISTVVLVVVIVLVAALLIMSAVAARAILKLRSNRRNCNGTNSELASSGLQDRSRSTSASSTSSSSTSDSSTSGLLKEVPA